MVSPTTPKVGDRHHSTQAVVQQSPEQSETELRILQELAIDVLSHLDLEETLLSILNAAMSLVDADIAGILLATEGGVRMRACAGHRTIATQRLFVDSGQGVAGRVFESGKPFKVDDYETDPVISRHFVEIARAEGKRSALGAPMLSRGETIGTLMAWRRRPSVFTTEDTRILTSVASLAAIAIVNAELYETERTAVARLEDLNLQLATRNELLRRTLDLHDELTGIVLAGSDLRALVLVVAKHTGAAVAVLGEQHNVLGCSDDVDQLGAHAAEYLRSRDLHAGDDRGTFTVEPEAESGEWLLITPVVAGGDHVGHLAVALPEEPQQLESVIVEQAAIVCALHLTREQAVWEVHARLNADLVWDLLEGNVGDEAEALLRADSLGRVLPDSLRVMLFEADGEAGWGTADGADVTQAWQQRTLLVGAIERLARDGGCESAFAARRGDVIALLVPGSGDPAAARRLAESIVLGLTQSHPKIRMTVGVSERHARAADLRSAHAQARSALSAVPLMGAGPPVAAFDDLGVLRFLLSPGSRDDLVAFSRRVLGPLLDYDATHPTDLVKTVAAFLEHDGNLQRTAESLYVHAKTVRYRLDRAQELAAIDLAHQQERFDVQLALTMRQALTIVDLDEAQRPVP